MDFELGLKITRAEDDLASTDFRIAKDRGSPVFVSNEMESMFILTAHLKGFKKDDIKININEDGTSITISGDKSVREIVMKGWKLHKKEGYKKGFRKTFKIPQGVVLDRIRARFAEDQSNLKIYMPKSKTGGICGDQIEEVREEKEGEREAGTSSAEETKKEQKEEHPEKRHEEEPANVMDGTKEETIDLQAVEKEFHHQPIKERDLDEMIPSEKSPANSSDSEKGESGDRKPIASPEIKPTEPPKLQLERKYEGETSSKNHQTEEDHKPTMQLKEQETDGRQQPEIAKVDNSKDLVEKGTQTTIDGDQRTLTSQAESSTEKDASPPTENHEAGRTQESNADADNQQNLFAPGILLGSALLASVLVFVVGFIKSKKQ